MISVFAEKLGSNEVEKRIKNAASGFQNQNCWSRGWLKQASELIIFYLNTLNPIYNYYWVIFFSNVWHWRIRVHFEWSTRDPHSNT